MTTPSVADRRLHRSDKALIEVALGLLHLVENGGLAASNETYPPTFTLRYSLEARITAAEIKMQDLLLKFDGMDSAERGRKLFNLVTAASALRTVSWLYSSLCLR